MRPNINIAIFGCALALVCALAVVLVVNFAPHPEDLPPNLGFVAFLWVAAFFVPAFLTGSRAPNAGALFGLVVGLVPLLVGVFFGYDIPWFLAVLFYAFAPLGGFMGQRFGHARSTG